MNTTTTTIDRRHPARVARTVVGVAAGLAFGGMLAGFLLIPQPAVPAPAETAPGPGVNVPAAPAPADPTAVPAPAPDAAPPGTPVDATTGGSGG